MNRRKFLSRSGVLGAGAILNSAMANLEGKQIQSTKSAKFEIALSQWGFHREIFGDSRDDYQWFIKTLHEDPDSVLRGNLDPRDIVVEAARLGVHYVDLVNVLWFGHVQDDKWLKDFESKANEHSVEFFCLMCDQLGQIGSSKKSDRLKAVENHVPWMEVGARLGCCQLRVNAYGDGTYLEQLMQCAESITLLAEKAKPFGLEIVVENHGHPSSNGAWLAMLMQQVNDSSVGVYADLDNFFMGGWNIVPERRYDRDQGLMDLAPYAKAVSAKSHDFDAEGNETTIDYHRCFEILIEAGFNGIACAEYEGSRLSEWDGNRMTVELLRKIRG